MNAMHVYHVAITAADDYITRRTAHRPQHLERIVGLRAQGAVVGGGPAPDGKSADLLFRAPDLQAVNRAAEGGREPVTDWARAAARWLRGSPLD